MHDVWVSLAFLGLFIGGFGFGCTVQRCLQDHHLSPNSIASVRVLVTLLVTFAALVLSLVISSSQQRFGEFQKNLRGLGIEITQFDQLLREYGPEGDPLRAELILYTKAAIADTWPGEPVPGGAYPRHLEPSRAERLESPALGGVLSRIDLAVRRLAPQDAFHRDTAAAMRSRVAALQQHRWRLIESGEPSLSWPFFAVLLFWMVAIFAIAGLSSPRNVLVSAVVAVAALCMASSIFLVLELDAPLTGMIRASSTPLRNALVHITRAPLPVGAP